MLETARKALPLRVTYVVVNEPDVVLQGMTRLIGRSVIGIAALDEDMTDPVLTFTVDAQLALVADRSGSLGPAPPGRRAGRTHRLECGPDLRGW